jgi:hypothetical protein
VTDPVNPGQSYGGYNPYPQQGGPQGGAQGGTPYPSAPPPGNPYGGPPPSNPYAPSGGEAPAPPPYGAPTPPPRKRGGVAGRLVGSLGGLLLVVILVVGGGYVYRHFINKSDTVNAKVGDCIHSDELTSTTAKEVKNTKIVKCDDASANYKVVGVVSGKTEIQFDADNNICSQYPDAESALWQGVSGKVGSVLCLAPNKK